MNEPLHITQLKTDFLGRDGQLALRACDQLATNAGDDGRNFLISSLGSSEPQIRNRAAVGIRESKDQRALTPLLRAILAPQNKNYNGTLVFALEALDCTVHFQQVFDILFYQSYEAKMSAAAILSEQSFIVNTGSIQSVKQKWEAIPLDPSQCPAFEDSRDYIQDIVDSYVQMVAAQ